MEYNVEKREIFSDKELNNLDKFALEFTKIVGKHVEYVIIAGYVAILLGRTRITEDIDMFIKHISEERFFQLYDELVERGFWCLNADSLEEVFSYIKSGLAIRFAKKGKSIPNFEVKFPKDLLDEAAFGDSIMVFLSEGKLRLSSLERTIAFKRYFLGSDKDKEDAIHLEKTFKDEVDFDKINKVKELIERRGKYE